MDEAASLALDDIHDRVGAVQLLRTEVLAGVRSARESGRYVEIRGEGGVGKSAVLKHVAEQYRGESPVLVCSPGRIPEGGVLALRALAGTEFLSVQDLDAPAVESLIRSSTLRDLNNDRVTFQHDILRDWAVAERLSADLTLLDRLPLQNPATAGLGRSVELAARRALERNSDDKSWRAILEQMSAPNVHGSWRRAVLLALVRSEIGAELLKRAEEGLLANQGRLLRELIRTVMAVEVEPGSFPCQDELPGSIPTRLKVPLAYSWSRLLGWLLGLGDGRLPKAVIPVITDLFIDWPLGTGDLALATPVMVEWLYEWLIEIEDARYGDYTTSWREPFDGQVASDELRSLELRLRTGVVGYGFTVPGLAEQYLKRLLDFGRYDDERVLSVLKFRGSLARAAPAELAELTARALQSQCWRSQYVVSDYELSWPRLCGVNLIVRPDIFDLIVNLWVGRLVWREFLQGSTELIESADDQN